MRCFIRLRECTSSLAERSATKSASDSFAKLSLTELSSSPRPDAANRLSNGIVYPCGFFQFEIAGGITQSALSCAVTFFAGPCRIGGGGDPGPRGSLRCR